MKTTIKFWISTILIGLSVLFLVTNCKKETAPTVETTIPVITTNEVTEITQTSATCGGVISSNGGDTISEKGICWSTNQSPTITDAKTIIGTVSESFTIYITGLTANTTYYVRAFATNSNGTGYGNAVSFKTAVVSGPSVTDIDGNVYKIVTIGTQTWMAENLKTTKLNDGTVIPANHDGDWRWLTTPAYTLYNADEISYKATYGLLYNWYSVNSGKLAPEGWHVATAAEWATLQTYLIENGYNYNGSTTDNKIAKALGATTGWTSSANTEGTIGYIDYPLFRNKSGFSALPGGSRSPIGSYTGIEDYGNWWTSTESGSNYANMYFLGYLNPSLGNYISSKNEGLSVRCIKD